MILKIVFIDLCITMSKWIICKYIFFPSIANLKCTPSDRQKHSYQGYMYPILGTPSLELG